MVCSKELFSVVTWNLASIRRNILFLVCWEKNANKLENWNWQTQSQRYFFRIYIIHVRVTCFRCGKHRLGLTFVSNSFSSSFPPRFYFDQTPPGSIRRSRTFRILREPALLLLLASSILQSTGVQGGGHCSRTRQLHNLLAFQLQNPQCRYGIISIRNYF